MGLVALLVIIVAPLGDLRPQEEPTASLQQALDDAEPEAAGRGLPAETTTSAWEAPRLGGVFWVGVGTAGLAAALLVTAAALAGTGEVIAAIPSLPGSTRAVAIYTVWWASALGFASAFGLVAGSGLALYGAVE